MDANEIRIGMPATIAIGSDRRAATVVAIGGTTNDDGTRIIDRIDVREDAAIRIGGDGISESQAYRFETDPYGTLWGCRLDAKGNWRGRKNLLGKRFPATVFVGRRDHYRDPTF